MRTVFFDDDMEKHELKRLVDAVPADEPLKIYISGHGGTGIDYITANDMNRKRTVRDLFQVLKYGLKDRATVMASAPLTQVCMLSCLFARTPDGNVNTSPAAKLHQELATARVYVSLVARTELVVTREAGRQTMSPYHKLSQRVNGGTRDSLTAPKLAYTKMLYTFENNSRVIRMCSYDPDDPYPEPDPLESRRLLWADRAVNELLKCIHPVRNGNNYDVPDVRQGALMDLLANYYTRRDPAYLRELLARKVDGSGDNDRTNFLTHRDSKSARLGRVIGWEPKTATLVKQLLKAYPMH
jgi:hypothetical protein